MLIGGSGAPRPTPIILNAAGPTAAPGGVQIQSSSSPVMIQSPSGSGSVVIMSSAQPPQPVSPGATGGGITIRSSAGATTSPPAPSQTPAAYNGPAAAPPVVQPQPQPVTITPSPPTAAPQVAGPIGPPAGVVRVAATSPQNYVSPVVQPAAQVMPVNQPAVTASAAERPAATSVHQTSAISRSPATSKPSSPRLTPGELMSKADVLWVCGFILAVVGVAFATMAFEDEISMSWLLLFVSVASVGAFVKLQL